MKSMTGFGKREMLCRGTAIGVEIRSVNHRFCEVLTRLPKGFIEMELELKDRIRKVCERGRIELTVIVNGTGSGGHKAMNIDRQVARQYVQELRALQQEFHLGGIVDINVLAGFRDIFVTREDGGSLKGVTKSVNELTQKALLDLEKMRKKEGLALQKDLTSRIQTIKKHLQSVHRRIPSALQAASSRLQNRVVKLLGKEHLPPERVAQEVALLAERSDVTEELTRLDSHVSQFCLALKGKGPVGKRLDFLLQEMGREVNTIGSKANDIEISSSVVEMKSELEKIREQVQNIE